MTYLKFKLNWGKLNMFKKLPTFLTLAFLAACSDGVDRSNYNETPAAPAPTPAPVATAPVSTPTPAQSIQGAPTSGATSSTRPPSSLQHAPQLSSEINDSIELALFGVWNFHPYHGSVYSRHLVGLIFYARTQFYLVWFHAIVLP